MSAKESFIPLRKLPQLLLEELISEVTPVLRQELQLIIIIETCNLLFRPRISRLDIILKIFAVGSMVASNH